MFPPRSGSTAARSSQERRDIEQEGLGSRTKEKREGFLRLVATQLLNTVLRLLHACCC